MSITAEVGEDMDLEKFFETKNPTFVLRVRGDSMIEDHLCDGDYVVLVRQETANNGDSAVVLIDTGEATLKRVYFADEHGNAAYQSSAKQIKLQPANKEMTPRVLDISRVRIQGVVIGVLRSYK